MSGCIEMTEQDKKNHDKLQEVFDVVAESLIKYPNSGQMIDRLISLYTQLKYERPGRVEASF
jgi:hypothetical protein